MSLGGFGTDRQVRERNRRASRKHDTAQLWLTEPAEPLAETGPLSHTSDPETSRAAAARMLDSGALGSDQVLAMRLISRNPERTTVELAEGDERLRQRIGRRISELKAARLVRPVGQRDGCSTYRLTDLGYARLVLLDCQEAGCVGCVSSDAARAVIRRYER